MKKTRKTVKKEMKKKSKSRKQTEKQLQVLETGVVRVKMEASCAECVYS